MTEHPPQAAQRGLTRALRGAAAAQPALQHAAPAWRQVLDTLPHLVWVGDAMGQPLGANTQWSAQLGDAAAGQDASVWTACVCPADRQSAERQWQSCQSRRTSLQHPYRLRCRSGEERWFLVIARAQQQADGGLAYWVVSCTDIHTHTLAQLALVDSARAQHAMLDASVDCIKIIRPDGTVAHMNKSGCLALGVPQDETRFGMKWLDLLPKDVRRAGQRALQLARQGRTARFAGKSVIPGSKPQYWDNILTPMQDAGGATSAILCVSRNVTLQRQAESRLREASEIDELTRLPNRRSFNARLKRLTARQRDDASALGLLMIDLDHFKHVNDTLGHPAGDHLLRVLSRRLRTCLQPHGFVARLGGDEFAFLVPGVQSRQALVTAAQAVQRQLEAPITYQGRMLNGGMSIGGALFPLDAPDAQGLMKCADTALNDLKANGRGGIRLFSLDMTERAEDTASQLARARQLLRDHGLSAHYQAKVRLHDGQILGFEALLRWHSATQGWQKPRTVEGAFTDYELATRISAALRHRIFSDMADWLAAGLPVLPVAINAAPVEFLRDDFAERLLRVMEHYRIPPALLEVEVTEHSLGERGSAYVVRALRALKQAGLRITLDDFGTGHSSFTNLRDYPVDCIKIDADFVHRMHAEPAILAIIIAICQLGPALAMDVVAEGVETQSQRTRLCAAGCTIGQGYLYSHAVQADAVAAMLRDIAAPQEPVAAPARLTG